MTDEGHKETDKLLEKLERLIKIAFAEALVQIKERPDLMPYYPEERAVERGIDLAFGKSQITKQVTSSVLAGHTVTEIADRLQDRIVTMERASAVRAARTAVTNAQNAGRQDGYEDAAKMGITVRKRWIATKDERTRPAHGEADGQIVPYNEPFDVGGEKLMFPGDGSGSPGNIYNCRCTTRTVEAEGIEAEPRYMRVRDENGQNVLVPEMTYSEWKDWIDSRRPKTDTEDGKKKTASKPKTKSKSKSKGKSKQDSSSKKKSADNAEASKKKTAKSGLKKTSKSGKIKKDKELSDSSSPFVHVGEKAIKRVPKLDVFGDEEMNLKYRKANRDLLREVRDKSKQYPVGTEFSIVYDANMKRITGYDYVFGRIGAVTIDNPKKIYHAFHNHGSDSGLSAKDIYNYSSRPLMKSLTAIGNSGSVYCIYATESSNRNALKRFVDKRLSDTIITVDNEKYSLERIIEMESETDPFSGLDEESIDDIKAAVINATEELLRGSEQYGFKYIEQRVKI